MGDFMQQGRVATLHRFPGADPDVLEKTMGTVTGQRPSALMIPALATEMDTPALAGILAELAETVFIKELVLVLGRADREDYGRARGLVKDLPMRTTVVWPEGPQLEAVFRNVREALDIGGPGKGRDVWVAMGYLLGRGGIHAIALHDGDIVTYSREIPARLLQPVTHPELDFSFCKGFYPRISEGAFAGRVTRLLVWPLVDVLKEESRSLILELVGGMRYPLSGEFALTSELAARIAVPRDWGLEVGILAAVARSVSRSDICQAEICDNYEHKHQSLSPDDASRGLNRMAVEVTESLLRESEPDEGWCEDIPQRYLTRAREMIPLYRADARANGLSYDEGSEEQAVRTFAQAVRIAQARLVDKQSLPPLPMWSEANERIPGLMEAVVEAVRREEP